MTLKPFHIESFLADKRDGLAHSDDAIRAFIEALTIGKVSQAQAGAWLMAAYLKGLDTREGAALTRAMADSGTHLDWSDLKGEAVLVDKHSSGGVGDKTTLVVAPIVAACGVPVMKLSGRGLGHTGGTLDKLESMPGLTTTLDRAQMHRQIEDIGLVIGAASEALAPADALLYQYRHETSTVASPALIAASILSKKLAGGADAFVFDIKVGKGAFMSNLDEAKALAYQMAEICRAAGKPARFLLTAMNEPLGIAVGNYLEMKEAALLLMGHPDDHNFYVLCLELAAEMLVLAKAAAHIDEGRAMARQAVLSGQAYEKLKAMVKAQGGRGNDRWDEESEFTFDYYATRSGYMAAMDAKKIGEAAKLLGAGPVDGRKIDPLAGIVLDKKIGDPIHAAERICQLHYEIGRAAYLDEARALLDEAMEVSDQPVKAESILLDSM